MKRIVSVVLVLVTLIAVVSVGVSASEEPAGDALNYAEEALVPVLEETPAEPEDASEAEDVPEPESVDAEEPVSLEEPEEAEEVDCGYAEGEGTCEDLCEVSWDGVTSSYFDAATLADRVKQLRTALVAHQTTISFEMVMKNRPTGSTDQEISDKMSAIVAPVLLKMLREAMAHDGTPNGGDYLLWGFDSFTYKAGYSWYASETTATVSLTVIMTYYDTLAQEKSVASKISSVLSGLALDGKSDYEKVEAIHEWICTNVTYDQVGSSNLCYTSYAALFNGEAVCQGFSTLFYRMCLASGVDCRIITGECINSNGEKENHTWNMVNLCGLYYYVDCTWDEPAWHATGKLADENDKVKYLYRGYTAMSSDHFFMDFSTGAELNISTTTPKPTTPRPKNGQTAALPI